MTPLIALNRQHPQVTALVGIASAQVGSVLENIPALNGVAILIGSVLGILIGIITLALKIDAWRHRRSYRRLAPRDEFERDRWENDGLDF